MAAMGLEGCPEQALVLGRHLAVAIAKLLDELGRPLDVGEQKGDRAAREVSYAKSVTAPRRRGKQA